MYISEEADKPPHPYTKGQKLIVNRHVPHPPIHHPYPRTDLPKPAYFEDLTQLQFCMKNLPLEGTTLHGHHFVFEITAELVVGDGHSAQLVVVNNSLVAKIYDPLYDREWSAFPYVKEDVVRLADRHYTREAAVYQELQDGEFEGTMIPQYHGSWTLDITQHTRYGLQSRTVRLILMEYVRGTRMADLDPVQLTEAVRDNIMVKLLNAERTLRFYGGVNHRDIMPRNVICCGEDLGSPDMKIVIIDFDQSVVEYLANLPYIGTTELPNSPIVSWWNDIYSFQELGWVPFDEEEGHEWLWKLWGGSSQYLPVVRRQEFPNFLMLSDDEKSDDNEEPSEEWTRSITATVQSDLDVEP